MAQRVLFIGLDPASMPLDGAPPGTAAQIQAGIDRSMAALAAAGFDAEYCALCEGDPAAEMVVRARMHAQPFDSVVIGAGLRLLPGHTVLFEALVNAVVERLPGARLAFNATPGDAAEAVLRQLPRPSGMAA